MALTPEDVRNKRFKSGFRGYAEEEVDTFLDEVEVELTRLVAETDTLRVRVETLQSQPPPQPVASEAEEMLRRTLLLAQRTADETVASAQAEAERMLDDARTRAATTVEQAEARAAESIGDLERRRHALEQHIEGLRAFEREYRTRLKAYLESQLRDLEGRQGADAGEASPLASPSPMPPVAPSPAVPPLAGGPGSFAQAPFTSPPQPEQDVPEDDDEEDDDDVPRLAP